jgi:hypothetical protein
VKSGGDFADILADGNPEIWISNRPAQGGETGAMFQKIVERALEMKGNEVKAEGKGQKAAPAVAKTAKAPKPTKKVSARKKPAPTRRTK